jgi:hypothetical protein
MVSLENFGANHYNIIYNINSKEIKGLKDAAAGIMSWQQDAEEDVELKKGR